MRGAAALAFACASSAALAAAPPPGPPRLSTCTTCHGARGLSTAPDAPSLAGQPEPYLAEQLKAYRSGKRTHPQMNVVAHDLTDAEVEQLAAWYAAIAIQERGAP